MIKSTKYAGMELDWETDKTWQRVFEPKKTGAWEKNEDDSEEDEDAGGLLTKDIAAKKCLVMFDESESIGI
jgi:hypothetical protein